MNWFASRAFFEFGLQRTKLVDPHKEENEMDATPIWVIGLAVALLVFLPLGIAFVGANTLRKVHSFRKGAVLVKGKVVDVKETTSQGGEDGNVSTSYQPMFEFAGVDGGVLRGETLMASSGYNFLRGSEHDILVNFDAPGTVHMPGFGPYVLGIAMLVVAAVFVFVGGFIVLPGLL